ncbi:MAG: glycosyltransferase family 4 protein [Brumimicrobium sp.]|nr:glycosyltransferase family 4 protein [Brumimicrobium sp.]
MERKNVLFLCSWYPSKVNPTLGNFVQKHAETAAKVANVTVLYAVASDKVEQTEIEKSLVNGLETVIVYYPKVKFRFPVLTQLMKRKKYLTALFSGYHDLSTKFDLVHLNEAFPAGMFAELLKKEHRIPYILTVHWTGYLDHTAGFRKLPPYVQKLHKNIFKGADLILPVSRHLGESLVKLDLVNSFEVIPNTVDSDHFYPSDRKREVLNDPINFIHISSFDDNQKNIRGMLASFREVEQRNKSFRLTLISEGDREDVWKLIDEFKLNRDRVQVESRLSTVEVADVLRRADCLVLFSNYETFSVVLAEAWMTGIPAIYAKSGGLTEIDDPELGRQIPRKNISALTEALLRFRRDDFDTQRIVEKAQEFTAERIAIQFRDIYNEY